MPIVEPRSRLKWFVQRMEIELQENDYKGNWKRCSFEYLIRRLVEEMGELLESLETNGSSNEVTTEAADVANFAMMIADNYFYEELERDS